MPEPETVGRVTVRCFVYTLMTDLTWRVTDPGGERVRALERGMNAAYPDDLGAPTCEFGERILYDWTERTGGTLDYERPVKRPVEPGEVPPCDG
jgi:hypothetical protein